MNQLDKLEQQFTALSQRERYLSAGVGFLAVVGLTYSFLLAPVLKQTEEAETQIAQYKSNIEKANEELLNAGEGVNAKLKAEIDALNKSLKEQQEIIQKQSTTMVNPNDMVFLLKSLLKQHDDVQLVALETLPVDSFLSRHGSVGTPQQSASASQNTSAVQPSEQGAVGALSNVYQHTVKLTVRGSYFSVMNYANDLKRHAKAFSWETAEMSAEYPVMTLTMNLYTLSLQNIWLGI